MIFDSTHTPGNLIQRFNGDRNPNRRVCAKKAISDLEIGILERLQFFYCQATAGHLQPLASLCGPVNLDVESEDTLGGSIEKPPIFQEGAASG
jgi:hypothetical protein